VHARAFNDNYQQFTSDGSSESPEGVESDVPERSDRNRWRLLIVLAHLKMRHSPTSPPSAILANSSCTYPFFHSFSWDRVILERCADDQMHSQTGDKDTNLEFMRC
jgi:hypothetical protein